jgi:hypothetical protein
VLKECELVKAKTTIDWQIEEQMHFFWSILYIRELLQTHVDINRPLHSNWASLLELISQPVIGKQLVHLIA